MTNPPPPNRKVRRTGMVLIVLAVLAFVGTATGLDAHGDTGRTVDAVVGVVLLAIGIPLLRTHVPALDTINAGTDGLHVHVQVGPRVSVPWAQVQSVWLRQIGRVFGTGYLLGLRYAADAEPHRELRPFEHRAGDGSRELLIGLTRAQSEVLLRELPAAAGERYSVRG